MSTGSAVNLSEMRNWVVNVSRTSAVKVTKCWTCSGSEVSRTHRCLGDSGSSWFGPLWRAETTKHSRTLLWCEHSALALIVTGPIMPPHLLQAGGVQLGLINNLDGHLAETQVDQYMQVSAMFPSSLSVCLSPLVPSECVEPASLWRSSPSRWFSAVDSSPRGGSRLLWLRRSFYSEQSARSGTPHCVYHLQTYAEKKTLINKK